MRLRRSRFRRVLRVRRRRLVAWADRRAGVWLAWVPSWGTSLLVHGLSFVGGDTRLQRAGIIFVVGLIFGLVNAFIKPVVQILSIPLLGVIPESESVLRASNTGTLVAFDEDSPAGRAYLDAVARFLGETREMRFVKPERRNLFRVLFGKA